MPHKKFPRNATCPCGSGKKYRDCCYDRGEDWSDLMVDVEFASCRLCGPGTPAHPTHLRQRLGTAISVAWWRAWRGG